MKKLFGFTLAEIMIAMTVLGIICITAIPMMQQSKPKYNILMAKKAYFTAEDIINSLINDTSLYANEDGYCEDDSENTENPNYIGFDCVKPDSDSIGYAYKRTKFPFHFSQLLNLTTRITTNSSLDPYIPPIGGGGTVVPTGGGDVHTVEDPIAGLDGPVVPIGGGGSTTDSKPFCDVPKLNQSPNDLMAYNCAALNRIKCMDVGTMCFQFESTDGMIWTIPYNTDDDYGFNRTGDDIDRNDKFIYIGIDVNGTKGPNCYENTIITAPTQRCVDDNSAKDQFRLKVYVDGNIEIMDDWARNIISLDASLKGEQETNN